MAAPSEIPTLAATVVVEDIWVAYRSEMSSSTPSRGPLRHVKELVLPHRRRATVDALKGVSVTIHEGEHLGIVGSNGSGKSTLLRVIAGVQPPTRGRVMATSTPVLLGIQAALVPQLSGTRNVRLGLLALGYDPDEVAERIPAVVELAGIGSAINRPMNTYSAGMQARLTFSIAAAAEPEILLIDEALGAGDAAFAKRSEESIERIRERAGTILLVSHAAQTIEKMCTRAIWLNQGDLIMDGEAAPVARAYRWWAHTMAQEDRETAAKLLQRAIDGDPVIP